MKNKRRRFPRMRPRRTEQPHPPQALLDRLHRLLCRTFGCITSNGYACGRCSADLYGPDFVQQTPFDSLAGATRRLCGIFNPHNFHCDHCGARLSFARFYSEAKVRGLISTKYCTQQCFEDWLPL
jgi:hypothetical protein